MRALTLWPEWLPTFTHLDKRDENRSWPPPKDLIGQRFALHAGAHIGGGSWKRGQWMVETAYWAGWNVGLIKQWTRTGDPAFKFNPDRIPQVPSVTVPIYSMAIVATARLVSADKGPADPLHWRMADAWHWHVDEIRVLSAAVSCVGHQGVWTVPDDIAALVLAREPR